jgi:hypothetical protein
MFEIQHNNPSPWNLPENSMKQPAFPKTSLNLTIFPQIWTINLTVRHQFWCFSLSLTTNAFLKVFEIAVSSSVMNQSLSKALFIVLPILFLELFNILPHSQMLFHLFNRKTLIRSFLIHRHSRITPLRIDFYCFTADIEPVILSTLPMKNRQPNRHSTVVIFQFFIQ